MAKWSKTDPAEANEGTVAVEDPVEETVSDEASTEEPAPEAPAEAPKHFVIPAGKESEWVTPVKLAAELGIRPQIVYGYIRTGGLPSEQGEKSRLINREKYRDWQDAKDKRKEARAAKAAEAASKPKGSSGKSKATPSVEETLTAEEVEE
jgi:hypothetical protein